MSLPQMPDPGARNPRSPPATFSPSSAPRRDIAAQSARGRLPHSIQSISRQSHTLDMAHIHDRGRAEFFTYKRAASRHTKERKRHAPDQASGWAQRPNLTD
jgi:hypothetical protein